MKKKLLHLVAGTLVVTACLFVAISQILSPRPGVTKDNFNRIKIGMTLADVEQILGGPADTPASLPEWDYVTWFGEGRTTARIRITIDDYRVYSIIWTDYKLIENQH